LPKYTKDTLIRLLINISSRKSRAELSHEIQEKLCNESDWNELYALVARNGLLPRLFSVIKNNIEDLDLPFPLRNLLTQTYYANAGRNALLRNELDQISSLLKKNGIEIILLKGISNIVRFKNYDFERQLSDTDLLVKREDALQAWNLIQTLAYDSSGFMSEWHKKNFILALRHLPPLFRGQFNIDINWNLFFGLEQGEALTKQAYAHAVIIDGCKVLSSEFHLLHSIYHLNEHWLKGECMLKWYSDLLLILENAEERMDWAALTQIVREYKLEKTIQKHVWILEELFQVPFPMERKLFSNLEKEKLLEEFYALIVQGANADNEGKGELYLDHFKNMRALRNKILFAYHECFPSKEYMKKQQDSSGIFILYRSYLQRLSLVLSKIIKHGKKLFLRWGKSL
jgi:hypothetical protein